MKLAKKILEAFNTKGTWVSPPYGSKDKPHPLYTEDGRHIEKPWSGPKSGIAFKEMTKIKEVIAYLREAANNYEIAMKKGADYVIFSNKSNVELDDVLNGTTVDTTDFYTDYQKWVNDWKKKNNTTEEPSKEDVIKYYK
jgi:hypothetical protein